MFPPFLIAAAVASNGSFQAFGSLSRSARELNNGNGITGDLWIYASGAFNWDGDNGGTDFDTEWWSPINTVVGDWWFKLTYTSGTNFHQGTGDALNTWYDISVENPVHYDFYENGYGSGGGSDSGVFTCHWSDDGGSTTYHSHTLTITMYEESL